jgi:chromosome segregation ATPase
VTTANHPWGRVDADGTVYVRTADGERVIGSWQAGSPEEAIAFFTRKYESLETEVVLLEQRISGTDMAPAQASAGVQRLLRSVAEANALGDLDGLRTRLERLTDDVGHRREEVKAAREHARVAARETKERIVTEAEQIAAEATHWKSSGERMRELLDEWKAAPHAERAAEAVLWKRLSAARNAFTKRRKAYFATLEAEREDVRARKEKLCADAEALSDSTDWGPTANVYRELMRQWKAAGRADREAEAELWKRFRSA